MQLKYYENNLIPTEIHKFYDDLSNIYLKSDYKYGANDSGEIKSEKIGRYKLSKLDISLVEEKIDLGFLIYTKEGFLKQDEIILNYDKYILLEQIKEIIETFLNEIIDVSNMKYTNGKIEIEKEAMKDKYIKAMKVTISGLIIASHIFGVRKLEKLFKEHICYVDENNIPITYYIDSKDYDLSFILSDLYDLIYPKVDEKELSDLEEIEKDEFIGQNQKDIIDQLKKELENEKKEKGENNGKISKTLENISKKFLSAGVELGKEYIKKLIKEKFDLKNEENIDNKENGLENDIGKKSYIIPKTKKNIEKIKEKFKKDYGDGKYSEYFEDVTNRKIKSKDKKVFNEILKGKNNKNNSIIKQDDLKNLKNIIKKEINIIEYLYHICSKSKNPLKTLEESLTFLSARYISNNTLNTINIIKESFKSKAKNFFVKSINNLSGSNIKLPKKEIIESLGLVDVDDIIFEIDFNTLGGYKNTIEYKFLKLFKDQNLVTESYSKIGNVRKYKKARRLLDNLQIALIKSMVKLKYKNFDGVKENNIFDEYILFLDEYVKGLSIEEYSFFYNLEKEVNITSLLVGLIKSNYIFRDDSFIKISNLMYSKKYEKYTDMKNFNIDKVRIKKIFPSIGSLEYNMKLRSAKNISFFYKYMYINEEKKENMFFVCDKAKVSCTFCTDLTVLNVNNKSKIIENKNSANIKDKNIVPFKFCSINKVCVPKLSDWEKKVDNLIGNEYALMNTSKCFCEIGGVISIVDPNQNKHSIKDIDKREENALYDFFDYKPLNAGLINDIRDMYFSFDSQNTYKTHKAINTIPNSVTNYLKKKLKSKFDSKNLENDKRIIAVDPYRNALVNIYPLGKYIKGYYLGKNFKNIEIKDLDEKKGYKLYNNNYIQFIIRILKELEIVHKPYNIKTNIELGAYWMEKVFKEYEKNKDINELKKSVIKYHKYGGNINADINTPWCASFANYIMDNGLKSASSQIYYRPEGQKYYNKIKGSKYGALLVLKYGKNKGHVTFIISETNKGYFCIGGNQGGVIKKSFYEKNNKVVGIFWYLVLYTFKINIFKFQ